jgi:serine/threonine protein kinase
LGTARYAAPEILKGKPYDGLKADIFSLGVVLLTLTTCKFGFIRATLEDKYYKYIAEKKYEQYWKNLGDKFPKISEELKNLFTKMIAYQPKERPSIEEILNSSWMKEINDLNQDELEQLEKELKEEFLKRQPLVDAGLKEDEIKLEQEDSEESSGNKGSNNNYENYFDLNLKPKYEQSGINMNNYIKLKGNEINPAKFMNMLIGKIKNQFNLLNDIQINEKKFKFNVTFNEENEDLNEEEEENENIKGNKTNIEIKIYESYNGGYLLRFVKKEGEISNYLDILKKIYALITNK